VCEIFLKLRESIMKAIVWIIGIPAVIIVLALIASAGGGSGHTDAERDACTRALASSMNAPVRTYADKAAYDAEVARKCAGYDLSKLGR
jgi:hypothetical protein